MNWLLAFLRNYLLPGVDDEPGDDTPPDPEDDPAPPGDDTPPDPEDDPAPPGDDTPPDPEDDPAPRESRAQKTIRETRERAQKAERELADMRRDLEAARRPQQPAQPDPEQAVWQEEEAVLRNPEATDWQKYSVQSRRDARLASRQAHQALQRAEDISDRTAFQAIATSAPKTYAQYKDRVEAKVQELRAAGRQPPPREAILHLFLGQDMLAGKLRTSEKPKKPNPPAAPRRTASSDVPASGRARLSEAEARAKRLENVRI